MLDIEKANPPFEKGGPENFGPINITQKRGAVAPGLVKKGGLGVKEGTGTFSPINIVYKVLFLAEATVMILLPICIE